MKLITKLPLWPDGKPQKTIGLVPTMGYLHEGHASLIRRASEQCDIVVVSIFVNPLQFGPNEDYERYPRDLEQDKKIAESAGAQLIFAPTVDVMYPREIKTTVQVQDLTNKLCGASRPGHFDGVTTVVSKLLHIVQPDKVYFGMKDAQQVAVISRMVDDLNIPVEVIPCPIVREADGLALSSRNVYLSAEERKQALVISKSLQLGKKLLNQGSIVQDALHEIKHSILEVPEARIDYVEIVSYPDLEPLDLTKSVLQQSKTGHRLLIAAAVWIGNTRLIDNIELEM